MLKNISRNALISALVVNIIYFSLGLWVASGWNFLVDEFYVVFVLFYYIVHSLAEDSNLLLILYTSIFFFISTTIFYFIIYFLLWIGNKKVRH